MQFASFDFHQKGFKGALTTFFFNGVIYFFDTLIEEAKLKMLLKPFQGFLLRMSKQLIF